MKRRLTIARALINEPSILLLDEPTTGLDPQARHLLWERLYRLKQRGVTLVLTTHYMDEAEQLCDRLVVMDKAKIVAEGSPAPADRAVLHARGHRAALPGGRAGDARRRSSTASASGSRCCPDRVLVYSDDGEAAAVAAHERGLRAGDGPRPAELAGGRVPAPDRPQPGGLMPRRRVAGRPRRRAAATRPAPERRGGAPARLRAPVAALPADLARLDLRQLRQPVLFLVAMGIGLGRLRGPGATARRSAACPYLQFLAPGAARVARSCRARCSRPRSRSWPGSTGSAATTRCTRRPLTPYAIAFGQIAWIATRATLVGAIFVLVIVLFGAAATPGIILAMPVGDADGARVRGADRRVHVDPARHDGVQRRSGGSGSRRCSCSRGTFFPIDQLPELIQPVAWLLPLWHGVDLARALSLGHAWDDPLRARSPTS